MKYDIDYFIKKFEAIPDEQWIIEKFTDHNGRYCALGHCGKREHLEGLFEEANELENIVQTYSTSGSIAGINDYSGKVTHFYNGSLVDVYYDQVGPKDRVLAFLRNIKNHIEGRLEAISSPAVTVKVETEDEELEKPVKINL